MKKINFIIFAIFFLVLVFWIGVYVWNYFTTEQEPSVPPSAIDGTR